MNNDFTVIAGTVTGRMYHEKCTKCTNGTFHSYSGRALGECFTCKGTGTLTFSSSPKKRQAARDNYMVQKQTRAEEGASWLTAHPEVAAYLNDKAEGGNNFAHDMLCRLTAKGSLTEGMLAAVLRGMARQEDWDAQRAAKHNDWKAEYLGADLSGLTKVFATARASGLKAPKLIVGELRITRAKDDSSNPGFLYINSNEQSSWARMYYGKVSPNSEFMPGRDAPDNMLELLGTLSGDVLSAAQAHGQKTGNCSCCNRELTDPQSIARGIGPVCAYRWGL
jgi:hypothetical protein